MDENMGAGVPDGKGETPKQEEMKKEMLGFVAKIETFLDEYMIVKAPFQIPMSGKELIVKVTPYLVIIFSVLALPAILALFGLSAFLAPVAMVAGSSVGWGFFALVGVITSIITLVLDLMALPGLFKQAARSWRLLFYGTLVSLVGGVLSMNPVGAIIGAIIGWYILFQVKELYKN